VGPVRFSGIPGCEELVGVVFFSCLGGTLASTGKSVDVKALIVTGATGVAGATTTSTQGQKRKDGSGGSAQDDELTSTHDRADWLLPIHIGAPQLDKWKNRGRGKGRYSPPVPLLTWAQALAGPNPIFDYFNITLNPASHPGVNPLKASGSR
jgi:hypothetical protein